MAGIPVINNYEIQEYVNSFQIKASGMFVTPSPQTNFYFYIPFKINSKFILRSVSLKMEPVFLDATNPCIYKKFYDKPCNDIFPRFLVEEETTDTVKSGILPMMGSAPVLAPHTIYSLIIGNNNNYTLIDKIDTVYDHRKKSTSFQFLVSCSNESFFFVPAPQDNPILNNLINIYLSVSIMLDKVLI
jgi:hypothetical protein